MTVTRRWKLAIVALVVYWPTLFILAHIPIPGKVRDAGVSDKVLHFLAYLILVFLFWIVLNPNRKVCWRKAAAWLVLLTMLVYGIMDELLQGYWGRSCDVMDLVADLAGVFAGLILLTFFTVRPAAVIICGATIFGMTNVARVKLADYVPVANAIFHLFSYAVFTLLWINCMVPRGRFDSLKPPWGRWPAPRPQGSRRKVSPGGLAGGIAAALALPTVMLLVTKGYSIALGKEFPVQDIILAVVGIAAAVGAVSVSAAVLFRQSTAQVPGAGGGPAPPQGVPRRTWESSGSPPTGPKGSWRGESDD
jgi:VanZ family protein